MADLMTLARAGGVEARAVLLGDRLNVRNFEPQNVLHKTPLAFQPPEGGLVAVYRFGAVVFVGVDADTQMRTIGELQPHVIDVAQPNEVEAAKLVAGQGGEDALLASGAINLADLSVERLLAVADVLAKSVALAGDERYMSRVFEQIEPFAAGLAGSGDVRAGSKTLLKLLGEMLVAQARMVGRVEVQERPDLLWDRPELHRLHAKLVDEYELDERTRALSRKLKVVEESAATLSNFIDTRRALRLEIAIVALIAFEVVMGLIDRLG